MLSSHNAELARRDSALPGLALLLDPEAFAAALRKALPGTDVGEARVTYVRYRPERYCLVLYGLRVTGTEVDVYAKAHRVNSRKLSKSRERQKVRGPLGPGGVILDDLAIAVNAFPNDYKLDALARLVDEEARKGMLRELVSDRPDLWKAAVRTLRYKPESHHVAKAATDGSERAILKFYNEREYSAGLRGARAFVSQGPLRVARLLGLSNRNCILAFEWLSGPRLGEAILDPKLGFGAVATVGAALAELHAQNPEGLKWWSRDAEATALLRTAAKLGFVGPHLARQADELARRIAARLVHEPPVNRPIHGDFSANQVLLADDGAGIVDLDTAARGDPAADLGNFIAKLERAALHGELSRSRVEALSDALLEGYRVATQRPVPARIELYTAAGLLRRASRSFQHLAPQWPERIQATVERAEAILRAHLKGNDSMAQMW